MPEMMPIAKPDYRALSADQLLAKLKGRIEEQKHKNAQPKPPATPPPGPGGQPGKLGKPSRTEKPEVPNEEPRKSVEPDNLPEQPAEPQESKEPEEVVVPEKPKPPISSLPPEMREILRQMIAQLPPEVKEKLRQLAAKEMAKIEDKLVRLFSGALVNQPTKTHQETEIDEQRKIEEEERKLKLKKQREEEDKNQDQKEVGQKKDLERRLEELQAGSNEYNEKYKEVRPLIDQVYQQLEEVLNPSLKRKVKLRGAGFKINLPAVFRRTAARESKAASIDNKIFERKEMPDRYDFRFTLLVDLSGSMNGANIEEAFKAVIVLGEVLNRLGIKYEILGFQEVMYEFKNFDETMNDGIRMKISRMLDIPGNGNGNSDGPSLLYASKRLAQSGGKEKFLIVISDGMPADHSRNSTKQLLDAVKEVIGTTDQKLLGLGLGEGTEHVKKFYPVAIPNIKVEQLSETLAQTLETLIINPEVLYGEGMQMIAEEDEGRDDNYDDDY